uniref:DsbC family protein n=1 Tax=Thermocrinis ruber TaxID=75906 RepID=A0A7C5X4A6_9AQUI
MRKVLALALFSGVLLVGCRPSGECPARDSLRASLQGFIPGRFEVESVQPLKELPSICEVVLKVGAQSIIFYTNKDGRYVLAGNLIDLVRKQNLTQTRQQELMKISQDLLKELQSHTDFVFGKVGSQKYIYLFTDPDCPFCKRSEPIVEKWANEKGVEVRAILFPLPIHPQAFGKSVALICDKKGWEEYKNGYTSNNQCEDGKKKVESNLQLAEKYGIRGTPTFIGMNGKIHIGVPIEQDLDKLIN